MVEGVHPPWLRATRSQDAKIAPWLYCIDCRERYFQNGRKPKGHIPYRDKASQPLMKKMHDKEPVAAHDLGETSQSNTQREPEMEPEAGDSPVRGADEDVDTVPAEIVGVEGVEADGEKSESGEERQAMDVDPELDAPDTVYPSLDEYKEKWAGKLAKHSMVVPGEFSTRNLVPEPISQLWQDCPHVPFDRLISNDAVSRLSRCRPMNGFTPAHAQDGHIRYAHNTGEVNFWRRHPLQLASTLGFILNKRAGHFPGLCPEEKKALHECLTWLRQPGNNPVCFFGQELENFDRACKTLMAKIKTVLPEGSTRARIRATTRISKTLEDGTVGDTLGEEARGMVVIDYEGHPHKYDQMEIFKDIVAKEINVLKIDAPQKDGKGWKRTYSEISTQDDLGEDWQKEMSQSSKYVLEESWIKANDPHYDAKCYPHMHPHGTGSVLSEQFSGSPKAHFHNRATAIQSLFRRSALWAFWKLDWLIKHDC